MDPSAFVPALAGIVVASAIIIAAKAFKFDRDRSFYPVILIVIASYYPLFALIARDAVLIELTIAGVFFLIAVSGTLRFKWLIGIGLMLHGGLDMVYYIHPLSTGVPHWWPVFCAVVDVILGVAALIVVYQQPAITSKATSVSAVYADKRKDVP